MSSERSPGHVMRDRTAQWTAETERNHAPPTIRAQEAKPPLRLEALTPSPMAKSKRAPHRRPDTSDKARESHLYAHPARATVARTTCDVLVLLGRRPPAACAPKRGRSSGRRSEPRRHDRLVAVGIVRPAAEPASPFVAFRSSGDERAGASLVAIAITRWAPSMGSKRSCAPRSPNDCAVTPHASDLRLPTGTPTTTS